MTDREKSIRKRSVPGAIFDRYDVNFLINIIDGLRLEIEKTAKKRPHRRASERRKHRGEG